MTHTASVLHCILTTHTVEEHNENMTHTASVLHGKPTTHTTFAENNENTTHTASVLHGKPTTHTHTHTHKKKLFLDQMLNWPCPTFCENRVALVPVVMKI